MGPFIAFVFFAFYSTLLGFQGFVWAGVDGFLFFIPGGGIFLSEVFLFFFLGDESFFPSILIGSFGDVLILC